VPERVVDERWGLVSLPTALLQIFGAGWPAGYLPYQFPLLLFAILEVINGVLSPRRWWLKAPDAVLVSAIWLPIALVGASVFAYVPARYFHFASPPLLLLAVAGIRRFWGGQPFPAAKHFVRLGIVLVLGPWLAIQMIPPALYLRNWTRWVLLIGLPVPLCMYWLMSRISTGWQMADRIRHSWIAGLLTLQLLIQGGLYYLGVVRPSDNMARAAAELAVRLPENARLVGRLSRTFALLGPMSGRDDIEYVTVLEWERNENDSVWVLLLEGDESLVSSDVWPLLDLAARFPVDYARFSKALSLYHLDVPKSFSRTWGGSH